MVATTIAAPVFEEELVSFNSRQQRLTAKYLGISAHHAYAEQSKRKSAHIEEYSPCIRTSNVWLSAVEKRIRDSTLVEEFGSHSSTEWLKEDIANAAIEFFRVGADLLPTEPHIYASRSGELVAEFETPNGNMTSIVSNSEVTLFGVSANIAEPLYARIPLEARNLREQLRSFTRNWARGSHGLEESAG